MSPEPAVVVHQDKDALAQAAAARLLVRVADAQRARGVAHVVLTGGGVGIGMLRAVAASGARDTVDWNAVDLWWGDERFLPEGDPERNVTQAREALLDGLPLDPARVHAMAASDGPFGDDADAAAAGYADELAKAGDPTFDVVLLGVGPDGHVASLFPGHPGTHEVSTSVIGVHGSPKPPPTRISLTFPALNHAAEVWLIAAGAEKAAAIAMGLSSAGTDQVPAGGVRGTQQTLWLLDRAAAKDLPPGVARPAAP